ncbi:uncharacterized protein LOC121679560 [Alosa sapidissima]|uniref:uncharacterized protein LOC121679560 n=1 Tax=Alosa sapidissima TaxID=34773 RepID=UPI001C0A3D6E|nr:uncharacterized protein LOC121679560 [Alosa sapidissima]
MPMMICIRTVPVCVTPGSSQSQLSADRELRDSTLQRLRHSHSLHTHTQSMKPAMPAAHIHRLPTKLASGQAPHQPDQASLHPGYSSRPCEPTSPSSISSSSSVSKNGSPRLKRVRFADSVGLPLSEVRVFTCQPPVDVLQRYSSVMKRAPGASGVCAGRCPLHQAMPASPQPCADFPGFRGAARPQDRALFQMHNDTLRRVNTNSQRHLTHGLPKAGNTQANAHLHAPAHGLPKAYAQVNGHTHHTAQTQTQTPEHTHATMRTQTTEHTHPATHTLPKAHPQQPLTHTLPKGLTHTHSHSHTPSTSQHPPSCGNSFMASSRQQPASWYRGRSSLPPPDSPPHVPSLAAQSWAWQEGMAVH